jgi:hypothetical protein
MGNLCQSPRADILKKPQLPDLEMAKYEENNADLFLIIDKFIIFKYFTSSEIVTKFDLNFKEIKQDEEKNIAEPNFNIFVEKKFINSNILDIINDRPLFNKLKAYNDKFFSILRMTYKTYYKELFPDEKKYKSKELPFHIFLAIAILYGNARNDNKMEFFFNYFCDQKTGNLVLTDNFRHFIFGLFSIPSTVSLFILMQICDENEEYKNLTKSYDLPAIFAGYEIKDAINCVNKVISDLFDEKTGETESDENVKSLTYEQFQTRFKEKDLKFLLDPKGIRSFINTNNV